MEIRIDKVLTPRGWIASAKMYSLILKDNNLYLINTGPGVQIDLKILGVIEQSAVNFTVNRGLKKVAEGEKRMESTNLDSLVGEKNNYKIPISEIDKVDWDENGQFSKLVLHTRQGRFKFNLSSLTDFGLACNLVSKIGSQTG